MDIRKRKKKIVVASILLFTMYIIIMNINRDSANFLMDITDGRYFLNMGDRLGDGKCIFMDTNNTRRNSVDLRVIVITYNRAVSLVRLLQSLEQAYYQTDRVVIEIWLDRSKSHEVHYETLEAALLFKFSKGKCHVYVHPMHVGIRGQWLSTWEPVPNSQEIGVILEDDLTVSPYFYTYLKTVHRKYRDKSDIYGFSLQGKNVRHSDGECCIEVPLENKVFLYPTLGTSGFSPKNREWLQFLSWYNETMSRNISIPLIKNLVVTQWYKQLKKKGKADTMWEMEYLYYTRKNKEFSLYPNFPDHRGLTFNWYEDGLHFEGLGNKTVDEERKTLVTIWNLGYDELPDNPTWNPEQNSSEIGVILEDDLTVSPYFYKYLKTVHRKYCDKDDIYGFSLQGKSVRHSDGACCIEVPLENKVFLYPTLGTSGFSPKNRQWQQFLSWYNENMSRNISIPLIKNHASAKWYKELKKMGKVDTMWEMEYLYYTRKHGMFSLYPNFQDHRGLTFNWYEDGFAGTEKKVAMKNVKPWLLFGILCMTSYRTIQYVSMTGAL